MKWFWYKKESRFEKIQEDTRLLCVILNRQFRNLTSKEYIKKLSHDGLSRLLAIEESIIDKHQAKPREGRNESCIMPSM